MKFLRQAASPSRIHAPQILRVPSFTYQPFNLFTNADFFRSETCWCRDNLQAAQFVADWAEAVLRLVLGKVFQLTSTHRLSLAAQGSTSVPAQAYWEQGPTLTLLCVGTQSTRGSCRKVSSTDIRLSVLDLSMRSVISAACRYTPAICTGT